MDDQNDNINMENIGLGCALEMFSEVNEVLEMIDNIKVIYNQEKDVEKTYYRFVYILQQYFEQPHLLDPHLDNVLGKMIDIIRNPDNPLAVKHETFKYMCMIVKVRGYKTVVRHLPHEVSDFEPVLQFLESQDPTDTETWWTRYVLLIWMSIIIMLPFHMSRLDGFNPNDTPTNEGKDKTVMHRVLNICKTYVLALDACRDAAVCLTSRFLTRSDIKEIYLKEFLEWAYEIGKNSDQMFAKYGAMSSIASILKVGKREDLLPFANTMLKWIISTNYRECVDRNILKFGCKIVQRLGLIFLKPQLALWRYKRGNRSLAENLSGGDTKPTVNVLPRAESTEVTAADDDEIEVPEEIEEVIDELLRALRHSDRVIRWSAAKGIGRVTGRLPKDMADDVVGSVLELFNPREGDGAWHGGCLALAELGRRGLLLPSRLPEVVPVVLQALNYDVIKGYTSVGAHIRDAACYVCWSFARAYESHILAPFVNQIASGLLIVAAFDREINCRRAASGAFQENVGRQGTFPHGIDILTTADFFTVGVRSTAYLNISVYIAQFPEYTYPLIDHLIERKVDHWDTAIRDLTAKALHNLTPTAPDYMKTTVLNKLVEKTKSIDLNARHGAVLAIGEVVYALSKIAAEKNIDITEMIGSDMIEMIKEMIPRFRERLYFLGLGGELMKQACASFIQRCSLAHLPCHGSPIIRDWFVVLDDCLSHEVLDIRNGAVTALPALFNEYFQSDRELDTQPSADEIIKLYTSKLLADVETVRMGYSLALGSLPQFMIQRHMEMIIPALIKCTLVEPQTLKWAQARRDAVKAVTEICRQNEISCYEAYLEQIYDCFILGLNEYTQDSRGDIGAWVREASMAGLQTLTVSLAKAGRITERLEHIIHKAMPRLARLAVERIDRTRAFAGSAFAGLLHNEPQVPYIPDRESIIEIFPSNLCNTINWYSESDTFPLFTKLLSFPTYSYEIMLGLIVSVGGLTEGLVKHSSAAFFGYLKEIDSEKKTAELTRLCDIIVAIFRDNQHNDRVTVPIFSFLDRLLNSGCITVVLDNPESKFASEIFDLVRIEITDCRGTYKLIDSINVLCQLIQVKSDVCNKALIRLAILLCSSRKYIRKTTSSRLYEALLIYGDISIIPSDTLDEAMALLSDTDWEQSVDVLKPIRNQLCLLLGVKPPVAKPKN